MALALGSQRIDEIHEQVILLWYRAKSRDPAVNPANAIYFALTDHSWPAGTSDVSTAIELCSVLSQAYGLPPLTAEQTKSLNLKAAMLCLEYDRGGGPMRAAQYVAWANRVGYVLAVVATVISGFTFSVLGLAVAVWSCHGAGRAASRIRREDVRPSWEVPVIAAMHLMALVALYVVTITRLVSL